MGLQAMGDPMAQGHLLGDVPALLLAGIILAVLMRGVTPRAATG